MPLTPNFWQEKNLSDMNNEEWEALCDRCGKCCLYKFIDEDTDNLVISKVACKLLDCTNGQCSNYEQRLRYVPDCISITYDTLPEAYWLPSTCAYKLLWQGKDLPSWHHLRSGSYKDAHRQPRSLTKYAMNESNRIKPEQHILTTKTKQD